MSRASGHVACGKNMFLTTTTNHFTLAVITFTENPTLILDPTYMKSIEWKCWSRTRVLVCQVIHFAASDAAILDSTKSFDNVKGTEPWCVLVQYVNDHYFVIFNTYS